MQVFEKFKTLLHKNPKVLNTYVNAGLTAVRLSLIPITGVMKHLILVQDLDPTATPGEKARNALYEGLRTMFDTRDNKDYDDDYDFSWFHKKIQETNSKLDGISLTKDKFHKLTDLANMIKNDGSLEVTLPQEDPVVEVKNYTKPKRAARKAGKMSKKAVNKKARKR